MKVLFISPNTERLFMPTLPLGLALVAAATRQAGHETRFLDLLAATDPLDEVRQAITEFQPEVIALSVRNVDDQTMVGTKFLLGPVRDVMAACRAASQAKIVVGGAGYSIFPEAALKNLGADRLYPHTPLARLAVEEGVVAPEDDLLMPRFYVRPGLEDYIRQAQGEI